MITINDIALALNLSTATVSNALSGKGRVGEANRQAIIEKAKEMGYDFSRLRVAPQRKAIAVFIESLETSFCCRSAEGIGREADRAGCRTVLYNLDILYDNDYNPPKERVREKMEEVTRATRRQGERLVALLSEDPENCIRDIAFSAAVRSHDTGDPVVKLKECFICK